MTIDLVTDAGPSRAPALHRPDPLTEPAAKPALIKRLTVVDKLRGLVLIIMTLDHVRDFFHVAAFQFSTTDLTRTTTSLFLTRWITHICAPTFVYLAGVAVFLQWSRGKRGWRLSRFLLARGLWLIVLEMTVVSLAFGFGAPGVLFQVIWAIGFSMMLLAALCWLPPAILLTLGLLVVGAHDLLNRIDANSLAGWAPLYELMLKPGLIRLPLPVIKFAYVAYPALPWFGIMAVGFGTGSVFLKPPVQRNKLLLAGGLAMLVVFALLRGLDHYGDPSPWTPQATGVFTALSFINVTKYPPSLDYTLLLLGTALSLAPYIGRVEGLAGRVLLAFGRVPLFTYLLHLYVARGLAVLLALAEGLSPGIFIGGPMAKARLAAAGWGVSLPWVYVVWVAVLLILWPISSWYAGVKERHRWWWLSYL